MKRLIALVLSLGLATAGSTQASDHIAIIRNSDNERKPVATVEVAALDQTSMTIRVLGSTPDRSGALTVDLEQIDFFAGADLVAIGNGLEAGEAKLVRCTSEAPVSSYVMLRGDQGEVYVPPTEVALGARFIFPIGDLGKGVTLLLGNPNQLNIEVDTEVGRSGAGRVTVPGLGVLAVPLAVANKTYAATSVGVPGDQPRFVAALVYSDKGRSSRMVMLTPGF
jgi:hypothetical protein